MWGFEKFVRVFMVKIASLGLLLSVFKTRLSWDTITTNLVIRPVRPSNYRTCTFQLRRMVDFEGIALPSSH